MSHQHWQVENQLYCISEMPTRKPIKIGIARAPDTRLKTTYSPSFSKEWAAWTGLPASIPTKEFAKFVDEHIDDIGQPPVKGSKTETDKPLLALASLHKTTFAGPEDMLLLSRGMKVMLGGTVQEVHNPTTGEITAAFAIEHKDDKNKPLIVPGLFMLHIPVFDRGAAYALPARLRYTIDDGKVNWSINIINKARALELAIADVRAEIADKTGLPTCYGAVVSL